MPTHLPRPWQEREQDRAEAQRRAQEAEALARKAAAGGYGGGSGPLRDADGRIVTDLNLVSGWASKGVPDRRLLPELLPRMAQGTRFPHAFSLPP